MASSPSNRSADWAELYLSTRAPLLMRAQRWLKDSSVAEDVIHDVFVSVIHATRDTGLQRVTLSYLLTCVDHACQRAGVRLRKETVMDVHVLEGMTPCIDQDFPGGTAEDRRRFSQHWLERACLRLPPRTAEVLRMYLEGHSYDEIAVALGIAPRTVDAHLQKAKKRLRKMYREGRERERERERERRQSDRLPVPRISS